MLGGPHVSLECKNRCGGCKRVTTPESLLVPYFMALFALTDHSRSYGAWNKCAVWEIVTETSLEEGCEKKIPATLKLIRRGDLRTRTE